MADLKDPSDTHSPNNGDDGLNGGPIDNSRGVKRARQSAAAEPLYCGQLPGHRCNCSRSYAGTR